MKSRTTKLVLAIYSLLAGTAGMIGPISYGPEALVYVFQSMMIAIGVVLLIPIFLKVTKILLITAIVVFGSMVVTGIVVFFIIPLAGLMLFAMVGIPFALSILTLVLLGREKNIK